MKDFFIPTKNNSHTPHLLHVNALVFYLVIIFLFNFFITNIGLVKVSASFEVQELVDAHNEKRELNGLPPLKLSYKLNQSALNKATAMLASNCWSHYCPEGKDWVQYIQDVDYDYIHAGENLAEGFNNLDSVMTAWMDSPSHRENILNENFEEIGIAILTGDYQGDVDNTLVVIHFGVQSEAAVQTEELITASDSILGTVTITSPTDGLILNDASPVITGNTNVLNSTVHVNDNDVEIGRVEADGPSYVFKPTNNLGEGDHTFQALINENIKSNLVTIHIDTILPYIFLDSIRVLKNDSNSLEFDLQVSEPLKSVSADSASTLVSKIDPDTWKFLVSKSSLTTDSIVLTLVDYANNRSPITLSSQDLTDASVYSAEESTSQNVIKSAETKLDTNGVKSYVAVGFVFYLALLLIIDFIYLHRNNMLNVVRAKSHLHLSVLLVFAIVILAGGAAGNILDGTTL